LNIRKIELGTIAGVLFISIFLDELSYLFKIPPFSLRVLITTISSTAFAAK